MRTVYIYALRDPRNNEIRYIGKTVQKLKDRLYTHIKEAKRGNSSYRNNWIRQILADNQRPVIEIIEETNEKEWIDREIFWIAEYRKNGHELTNATDGGEGLHGHKFSKEHRQKIGEAQKGNKRGLGYKHTEDHKQKTSKRMKGKGNPNYGKTFSGEYRKKLSESQKGRKHSEETKTKMRAARKKFYENPENRKKQSEAMKGNTNRKKSRGDEC